MLPPLPSLPVDDVLDELITTLKRESICLLEAEPGAGKTTRVPRGLLAWMEGDPNWDPKKEIVVLEPRRIAAKTAAKRVAFELGEPLGKRVGYTVRFEDVSSRQTKIRFVTEGILTKMMISQPRLPNVACVVLDEFHERHVQGDVALALLLRLVNMRADLKLVIMSATLDSKILTTHLLCPHIRVAGKNHGVSLFYNLHEDLRPLEIQVKKAILDLLERHANEAGDILIFLPGAREIRQAMDICLPLTETHALHFFPLHSELPMEIQERALAPLPEQNGRKVIFSTNIAESSLTIEGIKFVIDSGLTKKSIFTPWSGLSELKTLKICQASAIQRAGRAGRTSPGYAIRLYTQADYGKRPFSDPADILYADYTQTMLDLALLSDLKENIDHQTSLPWLDPPSPSHFSAAKNLLTSLQAIDGHGQLTPLGRQMQRLPIHPRFSRFLLSCIEFDCVEEGCILTSLLEQKGIFQRNFGKETNTLKTKTVGDSDLDLLLSLYKEASFERFQRSALIRLNLSHHVMMSAKRMAEHLARVLSDPFLSPNLALQRQEKKIHPKDGLTKALLTAFPDRVAKRQKAGSRKLALADVGIAELSQTSSVEHSEWLIAVGAEVKEGRLVVTQAVGIDILQLLEAAANSFREVHETYFNDRSERAMSRTKTFYKNVLVDEVSKPLEGEKGAAVMADAIIERGVEYFTKNNKWSRFFCRWTYACSVAYDLPKPDLAWLRQNLISICSSLTKFDDLHTIPLADLLIRAAPASKKIDHLAPDSIQLPSGRIVPITYDRDNSPSLSSYLQDFFGLNQSPLVGHKPLRLLLLAPNKRPVQVTNDLKNFWMVHYPSIRKELMRKYPKHAWPENPHIPLPMRFR